MNPERSLSRRPVQAETSRIGEYLNSKSSKAHALPTRTTSAQGNERLLLCKLPSCIQIARVRGCLGPLESLTAEHRAHFENAFSIRNMAVSRTHTRSLNVISSVRWVEMVEAMGLESSLLMFHCCYLINSY